MCTKKRLEVFVMSENGNRVDQQVLDLFVPGRLCLFGEHSDWAGAMRK